MCGYIMTNMKWGNLPLFCADGFFSYGVHSLRDPRWILQSNKTRSVINDRSLINNCLKHLTKGQRLRKYLFFEGKWRKINSAKLTRPTDGQRHLSPTPLAFFKNRISNYRCVGMAPADLLIRLKFQWSNSQSGPEYRFDGILRRYVFLCVYAFRSLLRRGGWVFNYVHSTFVASTKWSRYNASNLIYVNLQD